MEKRFQPDLSVRLTADSVEKHRDRIASVLGKIRRKDKAFKQGCRAQIAPCITGINRPAGLYFMASARYY